MTLAARAIVLLAALACASPLGAETAAPVAPPPAGPERLHLDAGKSQLQKEGPIDAARPLELLLAPVPAGRLEIHVFAKQGEIEMSVFRDGAREPESGTEPGSGAVGWISSGARELRLVLRATQAATLYRLTMELEPDDPPTED
jgi:hypothetical protein